MYIRVTRGRFDPGRYEDLSRVAEGSIQAARQLAGCRSFQIAVDRGAGKLLAVSTWEHQEQAQAIGQLRAQAEAAGAQFESPELFEVIAQT